jgi:very-short-patch-repair endonuclease
MQDKHLLERAKANRKAPTPFEAKLWAHLSNSQLGGFKFRRQHVIDNCIVDFFCPGRGLIVEIDGDTHDPVRDEARDRHHQSLAFATLRFTNEDVASNIDGVLEALLTKLRSLPNRWDKTTLPHPNPSPEGEGRC